MEERQNSDGSLVGVREKDAAEIYRAGGYAAPAGYLPANNSMVPGYEGGATLHFNINGTTAGAGGALSWQNNSPDDIIVTAHVLDITTASAGAGTISIGSATGSAVTANNMISAQSVAATATVNGGALSVKVAKSNWITGTQASGSLSGTVASVYFTYFRSPQPGLA